MAKSQLEQNIRAHNRVAKRYESIHGEIYNETEQKRLKEKLGFAIEKIRSGSEPFIALDFGCGAGNLTKHLADLGCEVIAADVSTGFLDLVSSRRYASKVTTFQLNGKDLSGVADQSLDMVAMYSVLHHVPVYLSLMKEFSRVLKKGGVIYIDHEASDSVWEDAKNKEFQREIRKSSKSDLGKYFIFSNYIDRLIRMFINPKYQREGDIHVFSDDHIEWKKIRDELGMCGVQDVYEEDYLLFRRGYDVETYLKWKGQAADTHLFIGRKI